VVVAGEAVAEEVNRASVDSVPGSASLDDHGIFSKTYENAPSRSPP
jgi:hypothetical protein